MGSYYSTDHKYWKIWIVIYFQTVHMFCINFYNLFIKREIQHSWSFETLPWTASNCRHRLIPQENFIGRSLIAFTWKSAPNNLHNWSAINNYLFDRYSLFSSSILALAYHNAKQIHWLNIVIYYSHLIKYYYNRAFL